MDTISLHMEITNSLNKTLKEAQVSMKSFNSLLENSQKNFTNISKTSDKVADNFDDIADDTERASKHTKTWGDRFSKVGSIAKRVGGLLAGGMAGLSFTGAIKDVLNLETSMKTLSFRMGEAGKTSRQLRTAVYETAKATGLNIEKSTELIEGLKHYRVATADVEKLGIATGQFSRITGVTADTTTRLTGQMIRFGKLSADAAKSVLTGMAQVQRAVGLTEGEMEQIATTTIKATATLGQYGKSSVQIESFNKGIAKLAGGFASVGVEAGKALEVIDSLLDPTQIEDNALLYAKLGISLQDAISGDVDPEELQRGFKNLGQELEGMSNMAAGQLAKSMGMSLRDLRAMADMDMTGGTGGGDLETMMGEQLSVQQQAEKTMNTIQVTMAQTIDKLATTFYDMINGPDGLKKIFGNKKIWLIGLLAMIPIVFLLRRKFMGLATSFGKSLTTATTEAISMGTEKGRIKAAAGGRRRGRGRVAETTARVTEGADYAGMQDLAETFDVMAKSNLFPFMARMTEHTADWVRDISLGSKKTSLLTTLTDEINQKIKDRLGMRKNENAMMTERLGDLKQEKESRIASLNASIREGMSEKEKAWVGKEISKEVAKRNALQVKIDKENENTRNLEIKAVRRMGAEEQARLMRNIQERKEKAQGLMASGKLERQSLRNQDVFLNKQFDALVKERRHLDSKESLNASEVLQLKKIEETMGDIVKKREEGVALVKESIAGDSEHRQILDGLAKESENFKKAVSPGRMKKLEDVGKSLMPESKWRKMTGFIGATFRRAGDNVTDAFDKAKKSAKQLGVNIIEKLKPSNWIKSIKSKIRGESEDSEKKNRGFLGGISKFLGPIGALVGIFASMKPVQEAIGKFMAKIKPLFEKLAAKIMPVITKILEALMPIFETFVDLLMPLVEKLMPPLLNVLGFLLKVIGTLIIALGKMVKFFSAGAAGGGIIEIGQNIKQAGSDMIAAATQMRKDTNERTKLEKELQIKRQLVSAIQTTLVKSGSEITIEQIKSGNLTKEEMINLKDAVMANTDILMQEAGLAASSDFYGMIGDLKETASTQMSQLEKLEKAGLISAEKRGDLAALAWEQIIKTPQFKRIQDLGIDVQQEDLFRAKAARTNTEKIIQRINESGQVTSYIDRMASEFVRDLGEKSPEEVAGWTAGTINRIDELTKMLEAPLGAAAGVLDETIPEAGTPGARVYRAGAGGIVTEEGVEETPEERTASATEETTEATTRSADASENVLAETQKTNELVRELITKIEPRTGRPSLSIAPINSEEPIR